MREITRCFLKWLVAGALGVAVSIGAAVAGSNESITLRVPVKLKKMIAASTLVQCTIYDDSSNTLGSLYSQPVDIVNGELDQVFELDLVPHPEKTFAAARSYVCTLQLLGGVGPQPPHQGTPPDPKPYLLARPDEFFQNKVSGPLDGGTFVDGIAGPKDLAVPPKPKE